MKFSIRDLLLVTVIVALAVGWWVERSHVSKLAEEINRLKEREAELDNKAKRFREVLEAVQGKFVADRVERNKPVNFSGLLEHQAPAPKLPSD
jgi:hypothetical protein